MICVSQAASSLNSAVEIEKLSDMTTWKQREFVEKAGGLLCTGRIRHAVASQTSARHNCARPVKKANTRSPSAMTLAPSAKRLSPDADTRCRDSGKVILEPHSSMAPSLRLDNSPQGRLDVHILCDRLKTPAAPT
ncbi:MAG: hypothetical protein ACI9W2_000982 [Gammaproteobacteria bacterium]|jgi:hypothetical protein